MHKTRRRIDTGDDVEAGAYHNNLRRDIVAICDNRGVNVQRLDAYCRSFYEVVEKWRQQLDDSVQRRRVTRVSYEKSTPVARSSRRARVYGA